MTRMETMENALKPIGLVVVFSLLLHPYTYTPKTLNGKLILMTDSTSTLGEAISYEYCKVKTKIMLSGSDHVTLEKVAQKCRQLGAMQVEALAGDIGDGSFRETLIEEAGKRLGGLDHLLLNHRAELMPERWLESEGNGTTLDRLMDYDFKSNVDMASKAIPLLEKTNGKIGIVSSLVGRIPVPTMAAYSASRAALLGFFPALRQELAHRKTGITVTSIALGYIHTENGGNAVGKNNPYFNTVWTTRLDDAAETVIINTELRKQEIAYPFIAQIHSGLHDLFPNFYQGYSQYLIPRMPKI